MLKDSDIDFILSQYDEKNSVLSQFGEQVSAATLYEDIFGDTDREMPVVIIDDDTDASSGKHIVTMSIDEALEQSRDRNDMLMGGCTFFNNWISKKSAKDIHSFIIDMDNVYAGVLSTALRDDWRTDSGEQLPKPTYIVNSGTGLHLYFVLDEPVPNYKLSTENLDKLYRALAVGQTTKRIYLRQQVQWFGQDFRMAGGKNKYNKENTIFRVGDKWDIDELGRAVGLNDVHFVRYGEPRQAKPITTRRKRVKRTGWHSNRGFYDYALENCRNKTKEGNRYTSMCALSVIAWKCAVPMSELERDLLSLLPKYNAGAERIIREKEIASAMKMYNAKAMLTQRERLEQWQGWEYKPIKRNGRKRKEHIKIMNFVRDEINNNRDWRNKEGRPSKEQLVAEWRTSHPEGSKAMCHRDTGIDAKTIRKWWNSEMKIEEKAKKFSHTTEITCRGCTIGDRKYLWYGLKSSNIDSENNTFLTFEPEPDNRYDSNAVKVVCRGELFGTAGYVGKEFTTEVKEIIDQAKSYVIELADDRQLGRKEITLKVKWNNE